MPVRTYTVPAPLGPPNQVVLYPYNCHRAIDRDGNLYTIDGDTAVKH